MAESPSLTGHNATHPDVVELVTAYGEPVYRYAYRLAGSAHDAEDLTQQTFLIAHQRLEQLRDPAKALAWLRTIARSCFLKSVRKYKPVAEADLDVDLNDWSPENVFREGSRHESIDGERLQAALDELPGEFRLVVVMFYFDQFSSKEIAEQLGVPPGTVMSRLSRAKAVLRRKLAARPIGAGGNAGIAGNRFSG